MKNQCRSFSRTHKFQKISTKIFIICRIKLDVKITTTAKLMPANLSILVIIKFIKANNKAFQKLGISHFLIIFCMPWELSHLRSKDFLFISLCPCLWIKNINGTCTFLLEILSSNNPETWLAKIIKD